MPGHDLNPNLHPRQFRNAVRNTANMIVSASDSLAEQGLNWYPRVHDVAMAQGRGVGLGIHAASGVVAAVSPSMDFENQNIHAVTDLAGLSTPEWDMISRSNEQMVQSPATGRMVSAPRDPEVGAMLKERAPNVAAATDANLMKANAIFRGGDYDEVMPRRTSPKTNAFAHTIEDPGLTTHSFVTIDGRQSDIAANQMRPWKQDRRIDSAALASGKPTRYEDNEAVVHAGTEVAGAMDPRFRDANAAGGQATSWMVGKAMEMDTERFPKKDGSPRKQGVFREGQPYIP